MKSGGGGQPAVKLDVLLGETNGLRGGPVMTEREFLRLNERLHRRQAAIRKKRRRAEPVHIRKILPGAMDSIRERAKEAKRK